MEQQPGLYGLENCNRDFTKPSNWGKNIFNNCFPVGLARYMDDAGYDFIYLVLDEAGTIQHRRISLIELLGFDPESAFFAFESDYVPYRPLVENTLPRADLIILNDKRQQCTRSLEIKLTALPDNSTFDLNDDRYGCELVIRPDTIVYLALSIVDVLKDQNQLAHHLSDMLQINDWTEITEVLPHIPNTAAMLEALMLANLSLQMPLVLHPIWKTQGKQLQLHQDAFDIFVWSNFAFTRLFFRDAAIPRHGISRGARSIIWLAKMLFDYAHTGRIDYQNIINDMTYNTKNDKAFAVNGRVTQPFMACDELTTPRIKKDVVQEIILGGGEHYLSPERRLDAAILGTPGLFE